ncbi:MAG: CoA transferase [Actinomycetota bacterium]|nr:CoA transferase [Actinomycetota bacterium]
MAQVMPGALEGLRVLDLTRVLSGPMAAMMLGDMGADVIKIEDPNGGDLYRKSGHLRLGGESVNYLSTNRNKRSVTLNLQTDKGREILLQLAEASDVLIENFRPESAKLLGIDWDVLRRRNERLIYCSITGFGNGGPYRDRPAVDPIIQAVSGLMGMTGEQGGAPVRLGSAVGDLYGAHLAVQGVLLALIARSTSAKGQRVQLSLLDAAVFGLVPRDGEYFATGTVLPRMGSGHPQFVPFQAFETADEWVYVAVFHDGLWAKFCAVLGNSKLAAEARFATGAGRAQNREALIPALAATFRTRPASHWLAELDRAGVPCAPINELDAVFDDPQVRHNQIVATMQHSTAGEIRTLKNPIQMSASPASIRRAPPLLGEHTAEVLAELGYSEQTLRELAGEGVIGGGDL